eukprot:s1962_g17.t1
MAVTVHADKAVSAEEEQQWWQPSIGVCSELPSECAAMSAGVQTFFPRPTSFPQCLSWSDDQTQVSFACGRR